MKDKQTLSFTRASRFFWATASKRCKRSMGIPRASCGFLRNVVASVSPPLTNWPRKHASGVQKPPQIDEYHQAGANVSSHFDTQTVYLLYSSSTRIFAFKISSCVSRNVFVLCFLLCFDGWCMNNTRYRAVLIAFSPPQKDVHAANMRISVSTPLI